MSSNKYFHDVKCHYLLLNGFQMMKKFIRFKESHCKICLQSSLFAQQSVRFICKYQSFDWILDGNFVYYSKLLLLQFVLIFTGQKTRQNASIYWTLNCFTVQMDLFTGHKLLDIYTLYTGQNDKIYWTLILIG